MIGAGAFRGEQQEHQVNRLSVHRIKLNGLAEPGKHPVQRGQPVQLAMRDGDPLAKAG